MDKEVKAHIALRVLELLDNHRYSTATGDPVSHDGAESLRSKAIAVLHEALS